MNEDTNMVSRLLRMKSDYLIPCTYHFYKNPMVIVKGEGSWLYDEKGKAYLDAYSGVGVVNCGHCNAEINAAVSKQLHRLQHTTSIFITEPVLELAENLAGFVPGNLDKSFFCTSGSEANEGALLLARIATGRRDFISLDQSLHGRTHLTASLTGMEFWRSDPFPDSSVHFIQSPKCHCSSPDGCQEKCGNDSLEQLETLLSSNGNIAGLIVEPIQGNGGINVLPSGWLKGARRILNRHDALLIVDEAQTGFCRTGKRFAYEWDDVEPDILTVCKALGNGLPISAFVTRAEIADRYRRPGASTFGGNAVCATAANASLAYMRKYDLEKKAKHGAENLHRELDGLVGELGTVKEIRGRGMMIGIEMQREDEQDAGGDLDRIIENLKDQGLLVGKTGPGRNVLTLMPPLNLTETEQDILCSTLRNTLKNHSPEQTQLKAGVS